MADARFFSESPGYHPFHPNSRILCETGNTLDLFIPLQGIYAPSAQKFGDFLSNNPNAELVRQKLQLYGYLAHRVNGYEKRQSVKKDDKTFCRIVTAILRISKEDGSRCGYLIRTVWLEGDQDEEDGDLEEFKDGPNKNKILRDRRAHRNPNHALCQLFDSQQHVKFREMNKCRPALWYHSLTKESYVRDFAHRVVPGLTNHDKAQKFQSLSDNESKNPAALKRVYSLEVALASMKAHGSDPRFLNTLAYANNDIDFKATEIYRVYPSELLWDTLQNTFFPDHPRPSVDTKTAEFQQAVRERAAVIAAGYGPAAQGGSDEEKKLFEQKCHDEAMDDITRSAQQSLRVKLETSNRELLAIANEKRINDAIKEAQKPLPGDTTLRVSNRVGLARRRAQIECLNALRVLIQQDHALDESYVAVRDFMNDYLSKHDNKLYRLYKRHPEFSNLTPSGEFWAMMLLRQEAIKSCYMVHRQSIVVFLASMHVVIESMMQPNTLILGKYAVGKSRSLQTTYNDMIPGTWKFVTGSSDKADLSKNGVHQLTNKAYFAEEMEPSTLGLENVDRRKTKSTDSSMTDKSARFRAGSTAAGEQGYDRLVQDPVTKQWGLESVKCKLNKVLLGCLNLQSHAIPGNVLSRFICLVFFQWQRGGQYQMASCKLNEIPEEYKPLSKDHQEFIRWLQMLIWWYALLLKTNVVRKADFSVTKRFIEEVILLARERGVNGVSEFRVLDHINSLVEMVTIICTLWQFFSEEGSPIAHVDYNDEQWLEVEKAMIPRIEHAAFVLTLLSDQFEPRVAYEVLSAIALTFKDDSPYYQAAHNQYTARKSGGDDTKEDSDEDEDFGNPPPQQANPRSGNNPYDMDYFHFTISVNRNEDRMRHDERSRDLVGKLYEAIEPKILEKPERDTCIHYLSGLTTSNVLSQDGKTNIPLLIIKESGECKIARVLLQKLSGNRLVSCVQEVLSRRHYPCMRYVFGCQSSKAPFIWKTFSTDPDDMPTAYQKKRHEMLKKHADRVRKSQLTNLEISEALKAEVLKRDWALSFNYAAQELAVWKAIQDDDEDLPLFGDDSRFVHSVQIIDIDREDHAAVKWLGEQVLLTEEVGKCHLRYRDPKELQPSIQTAKFRKHHAETVNRLIAAVGAKEGKSAAEAMRASIAQSCRYPVCFKSRHPRAYRQKAMQQAIAHPEQFILSLKSRSIADAAGLGFVLPEGEPDIPPRPREAKRQQQQQQEEKQPRPVEEEEKMDMEIPTPPRTPEPPELLEDEDVLSRQESQIPDEPGMDRSSDSKSQTEANANPVPQEQKVADLELDENSLPGGGIPLRLSASGEDSLPERGDTKIQDSKAEKEPESSAPRQHKRKNSTSNESQGESPSKRQRLEGSESSAGSMLSLFSLGLSDGDNSNSSGSLWDICSRVEQDELNNAESEGEAKAAADPATPEPKKRQESKPKNKPIVIDDDNTNENDGSSNNAEPTNRRKSKRLASSADKFKELVEMDRKRLAELGEADPDGDDAEEDDDYDATKEDEEQLNEENALLDEIEYENDPDEGPDAMEGIDDLVDEEEEAELKGQDVVEDWERGFVATNEEAEQEEAVADLANAAEEAAERAAARREREARKAAKAANKGA